MRLFIEDRQRREEQIEWREEEMAAERRQREEQVALEKQQMREQMEMLWRLVEEFRQLEARTLRE